MGGRRRSQMTFVVLTLIALSWVTFDLRSPAAPVDGPRRGVLQVVAPAQQALATIVRPVEAATAWVADQQGLHHELGRLRDVEAQARSAEVVNEDLAAENQQLRQLLSMRARGAYRTVGARVLGASPGDPAATVVLTAGTADGVAPDMAVVNHQGLVGRIVAATRSYARAELVTSPTARYAVRVAGAPAGRLSGGRSLLRLELNDLRLAVRPGAAVMTRAFEGSAIPDGLPIGTVLADPAHGRYVDVRPLVDMTSVSLVQVLIGVPRHPSAAAIGSARPPAELPPPPRPGER